MRFFDSWAGYLTVALLAAALGVCITVLCVRLRRQRRGENGARHDA